MDSLLLSGGNTQPEEIRLLDRMYQLRHTVFAERLRWTSLNNDRREIDLYDVLNPVYLICRDPAGDVVGCWRLLPTTRPYMLKDIFPHLLWGTPAPEQDDVWEISRFAIDPSWRDYASLGAVGSVVGQMLLDLFDFAEANAIRRIVAASDIRFDRILKRAGLQTTHYGPAVRMGELIGRRRLGRYHSGKPLSHRAKADGAHDRIGDRAVDRKSIPYPNVDHVIGGTTPWPTPSPSNFRTPSPMESQNLH